MCSSSGFPLWHWWSQWRLGKTETRYLLSHIRKNRQPPEIGFHFDVRGSVAYNCHGILFFNLFPYPFPSRYYFVSSLPFLVCLFSLKVFHFFALSFVYDFPRLLPSGIVIELHCRNSTFVSFVFFSDCMHIKPVLWLFRGDKWREWRERSGRTALWEGVSASLVMDPTMSVWYCQSLFLRNTDHKYGRELCIHLPLGQYR